MNRTCGSVAMRCLAAGLVVGVGMLIRSSPAAATRVLNTYHTDSSDGSWCDAGYLYSHWEKCGAWGTGYNSTEDVQCQDFSTGGTQQYYCNDNMVKIKAQLMEEDLESFGAWYERCASDIVDWTSMASCSVSPGSGGTAWAIAYGSNP